jgi:nickel/cobalt transporter (NiCoT) family protein
MDCGRRMSETRLQKMRRALTPAEWGRVGGLAAAVLVLHLLGFGMLLLAVVPRHLSLGHGEVFGLGLGITAYTLGLRHAFDADHIAVIDNTTRKLLSDGKRPLGVGFFFSLGHSTVVFALALLLGLGLRALGGEVQNGGSTLHAVTNVIGTGVSGGFLYALAAINVTTLIGLAKAFRRARTGCLDEAELERQLSSRGLMNRLLGRFARGVGSSWQMYPVGVLFGLGFDTATEVALLFLAAGAATSGLPVYAILCLPLLFAAGMSLLDTIDGSFMNFAYSWAFSKPIRKMYYNLTITGLSVAVAVIVGTVELLSVAAAQLGLHGAFWSWVSHINLNAVGYFIVGLFAVTWLLSLVIWRLGRIEERWPGGEAVGSRATP